MNIIRPPHLNLDRKKNKNKRYYRHTTTLFSPFICRSHFHFFLISQAKGHTVTPSLSGNKSYPLSIPLLPFLPYPPPKNHKSKPLPCYLEPSPLSPLPPFPLRLPILKTHTHRHLPHSPQPTPPAHGAAIPLPPRPLAAFPSHRDITPTPHPAPTTTRKTWRCERCEWGGIRG